jgi:cation transport regulator ChaC
MSTIWYFAYGSNMQQATFSGRRGIEPRSAVPARLAGWELVLDKPPLIPMGQSFANIVEHPDAVVYGVLYELAADDYAHVERTEAVPLGNYVAIEVDVEVLSDGSVRRAARTLTSLRRAPEMRPSTRYMALMIEGAMEHGLPPEWIAFLRGVPADEETESATRTRALLDDLLRAMKKPR